MDEKERMAMKGAESGPGKRIASIDALRGFDMLWITGGGGLIWALHASIPNRLTLGLVHQFEHVPWQGFHFYDLIFPLFIFVVGLVLPFSLGRHKLEGARKKQLYFRVVRRFVLLFVFGLIYNGLLNFNLHQQRFAGVLQRISICYLVAAIIMMNTGVKGQAITAGAILIGYWGVMKLIPVPGVGAGVITPMGNLSGYIDRHFLPGPFCCYTYGDSEGILSTVPAISTALIGVLAGHWLRSDHSPQRKAAWLAGAGVASLVTGLIWGYWFPIIKNIWTSSYVLFAAGWSLLLLALFYWVIDVRGVQRWAFPFKVIGMNAITIYMVWHLFDKFSSVAIIFVHGFIHNLGAATPLVWASSKWLAGWLFCWFLYRQKIFLRV